MNDINEEIWKDIEHFEGQYQVSNKGNVKSIDRIIQVNNQSGEIYNKKIKGKILKANNNGKGYLYVDLGRSHREYIHRLVSFAFLNKEKDLKEINHIDNNTLNNQVDNLEWITREDNIKHKVKQNRQTKGEQSHLSKLTELQVKQIKDLLNQKVSVSIICERFNVKRTAVYKIKNGVTWKHVS